jgi:hypothetical protein
MNRDGVIEIAAGRERRRSRRLDRGCDPEVVSGPAASTIGMALRPGVGLDPCINDARVVDTDSVAPPITFPLRL